MNRFYTAILDLDQDEVNHELLNAIASNPRYASLPLIIAGTPHAKPPAPAR
ncbi:MAG: hypothetical protein R3E89_14825 [Thiolinea sp.]